MGIDLELADCAAARYQREACREAGAECGHTPGCEESLAALLAEALLERPRYGSEFPYRQFRHIIATMVVTGMGYEAEVDREAGRDQTAPGKAGIPFFKLRSNDRWLITAREVEEALEAYRRVPAERRAELEVEDRWAAWVEWLEVARRHGGFEAE